MKAFEKQSKDQKGQALVMALIFLLALTFLGFGLVTMSTIDINTSRNLRLANEALAAAEQGAFLGLAYASNPDTDFYKLAEGTTVRLRSTTNTGRDEHGYTPGRLERGDSRQER